MITVYLCVSTVLFAIISFVWSHRTWLNVLIKFTFFSAFVAGLVLVLQAFGFIIKV